MAESLGRALLTLGTDNSGLNEGLSKGEKRTRKAVARMKKSLLGISVALTAVGAAVGIRMAAIDRTAKMAKVMDTTVVSVQNLMRAGELAGVTYGQMEGAMRRFTRRMSLAEQGQGAAAESFKRLGLSAKTLAKLPLDERVVKISSAIRELIPEAEQAGEFTKIFGEGTGLLIRQLKSEIIAQATDEIERFGAGLSEVDAQKIEETNDQLSALNLIMKGIGNKAAIAAAPALESVANSLQKVGEAFGSMSPENQALLVKTLGALAIVIPTLVGFGAVAFGIKAVTAALVGLGLALATPLGALAGLVALVAVGGAYFLLFRDKAKTIKTPLEKAKEAQDALNAALRTFSETGAPDAGREAVEAANDYYELAKAAREAAAANIAMLQSELAAQQAKNEMMRNGNFFGKRQAELIEEDLVTARADLAEAIRLLELAEVKRKSAVTRVMRKDQEMNATLVNTKETVEDVTTAIETSAPKVADAVRQMIEDPGDDPPGFWQQTQERLESSFSRAIVQGKKLADVFRNIANAIAEAAVQAALFGSGPLGGDGGGLLGDLFGDLFGALSKNAQGNVIENGRVQAFARGGIVRQPTLFPMANGAGLMGEAGPEAILPLKRGRGGQLGVQSQGQQSQIVNIMTEPGAHVERRQYQGPSGEEILDVRIGESIGRGRQDAALSGRFSMKPKVRAR